MEKYSLLRVAPHLFNSAKPAIATQNRLPRNSLYKLLDSLPSGSIGTRLIATDGATKRTYIVKQYERFKVALTSEFNFNDFNGFLGWINGAGVA